MATESSNTSQSSSSEEEETQQEQRPRGQAAVARRRVSRWDQDVGVDIDLLITSIQERGPLWDSRDPRHSDQVVLRRLWNEVAQSLWDGFDSASAKVQEEFLKKVRTRWRSMKDRFNRGLRKEEEQARSGAAAGRTTTYKHYRLLTFLRPVLARRATHRSTLEPGRESGAVLHEAPSDPSQPSHSESRHAPHSGEPAAGPPGVPLSEASGAPSFGYSRQRQRASDRPLMPEYFHLGTVFQNCFKVLGDRMDTALATINRRLESMEAELMRPAKHLTPELQISVMQACNNAYVSALQHARIMQSATTMPVVPTLASMTPSPAAQQHYRGPGAEGRRHQHHRTEPPSPVPARTSSTRRRHQEHQEGERPKKKKRTSAAAPAAPNPNQRTRSGSSRSSQSQSSTRRVLVPPPSPTDVAKSPPSATVWSEIHSSIMEYGSSSSSHTPTRSSVPINS
ncbi:uncharacterized protein [Ranitomeya imitator]|uniref:uncharacterized protein isoform X2 n=1 Tax=Ranitomeya imitator TaxID=111125 RepID=UPI0037E83C90